LIIRSKAFETVLLLDDKSESPSLTYEESNRLYQELKDYEDQIQAISKVKANEYFNGLQVKFSYALPPSQGGRWPYSSNNLICLTELTEISDGCIPRWSQE
jgi:hypothetical protein